MSGTVICSVISGSNSSATDRRPLQYFWLQKHNRRQRRNDQQDNLLQLARPHKKQRLSKFYKGPGWQGHPTQAKGVKMSGSNCEGKVGYTNDLL
jgi:hypothetical protein